MVKRVFLLIVTNILILLTISIVLNVLGIRPYLTATGINYQMLAAFCLVWGFGGAFISLAMSRIMAKWMMGVQVIAPGTGGTTERGLIDTVHRLARRCGITTMPEVGIFDSPEVNAFATGPTKNRALVAVSTGLLRRMDPNEIEGVLGHEISHVSNGDMVTMTLIQGIVNAFVMFLARVIAFFLSQNVKEENRPMVRWLTTFLLEILLSILGSMVVAAFSRYREYRADSGGARLVGKNKMIAALESLKGTQEIQDPRASPAMASLKISGKRGGFLALFATHPSLDERIARLATATLIP